MAFIASLFSYALLHFRDRLVRVSWIRHEPPTLTIDEQVQLLERRLPDEHFVTQNERFIERVSTLEFQHEGLRDAHGFLTSVGILGHPLAASGKAEASDDVGRQDRANRSGVHEGNSLVGSDFPGLNRSPPTNPSFTAFGSLAFPATPSLPDRTITPLFVT